MSKDELEGFSKLINAQFDNVHDKLDAIKAQTEKTNGRVTAAEKAIEDLKQKNLVHYANCPIEPRVRELENHDLEASAIKKTFSKALRNLSLILTIFATIITLVITLG